MTKMEDRDDYDYDYDHIYDDPEPRCHSCFGVGWVESVSAESGRYLWDTDGPGDCPNCGGSGLAKDCTTF